MSAKSHRLVMTITAIAAVVGAAGCSTGPGPGPAFLGAKVTGGGWIPSSSQVPAHKANFGFNAAQCAEGVLAGHFNFHDKHAPEFQPGGVKMNGAVVDATLCSGGSCQATSGCPDGAAEVRVSYRSTNPRFPGTGTAFACVEDAGEGANASGPDTGRIRVADGRFAGYANEGNVQGNIQLHTCTCTDGIDNDGDGTMDEGDPACLDPVSGDFDPNRDEE